ncbi:MAG TPA: hypothetical protein ENI05_08880 [Porticoccus sp.]|nr:hypothetical protein [Porticoccus sp.]
MTQIIKLELTLDELNFILGALGELPAKTSMALIVKIQAIAQEQMKPQSIQEVKSVPEKKVN